MSICLSPSEAISTETPPRLPLLLTPLRLIVFCKVQAWAGAVILHLALGLIIRGPVFGSTPAMAEEEEEEEERENTDG